VLEQDPLEDEPPLSDDDEPPDEPVRAESQELGQVPSMASLKTFTQ